MISNIDTGGYAFPHMQEENGLTTLVPGMTLRDWFAGMALQGLAITVKASRESMHPTTALEIVRSAYHLADIMVKMSQERSQAVIPETMADTVLPTAVSV